MTKTKKQSRTRRCRKCGKRQKGRGGKRKADALGELDNLRQKRDKKEVSADDFKVQSNALKQQLEQLSGQTGEPVPIPDRDWPMVEGKRRIPKHQKLTDRDIHEAQKKLLVAAGARTRTSYTQSQDQFTTREAELKDLKVPAKEDKVIPTDWRTVPGYPALPTDPATGDVIADSYVVPSLSSSLARNASSGLSSGISAIFKQVLQPIGNTIGQVLRRGDAVLANLPYPIRWAIKAGLITLVVGLVWKFYPRILKEALAMTTEYLEPWQKTTRLLTGGVTAEEKAVKIITDSGLPEAAFEALSDSAGAHAGANTFLADLITLGQDNPEALQVLNNELGAVVSAPAIPGPPGILEGLKSRAGTAQEFFSLGLTSLQALTENVADQVGAHKTLGDFIRWGIDTP